MPRDALGDIQDFPYSPRYQAAFRLRRLHTLSLAEAQEDLACTAPGGIPGTPRSAYTAPPTVFSAAWRAQVRSAAPVTILQQADAARPS